MTESMPDIEWLTDQYWRHAVGSQCLCDKCKWVRSRIRHDGTVELAPGVVVTVDGEA